jgi:hypothetical protein
MYIPFDAIRTFVDPSVEFGLRFETQDDDEDDPEPPSPPEHPAKRDAEVVSLDKWRK